MSERDSYSNLEESLDLSEHIAISPREVRRIIADARRFRDEAAEAKRLMLQVVDDKYAAIQDGDRARAEAARWRESLDQLTTQWDDERHKRVEAQDELAEWIRLNGKLGDLLTRTANALKGPPPALTWHDWSDLPEVAAALKHGVDHPYGGIEGCTRCAADVEVT